MRMTTEESLIKNKLNISQADRIFYDLKERIAQKLQNCNGARPDEGFLKLLMVQMRRRNIHLVKGEDNGTQE